MRVLDSCRYSVQKHADLTVGGPSILMPREPGRRQCKDLAKGPVATATAKPVLGCAGHFSCMSEACPYMFRWWCRPLAFFRGVGGELERSLSRRKNNGVDIGYLTRARDRKQVFSERVLTWQISISGLQPAPQTTRGFVVRT